MHWDRYVNAGLVLATALAPAVADSVANQAPLLLYFVISVASSVSEISRNTDFAKKGI